MSVTEDDNLPAVVQDKERIAYVKAWYDEYRSTDEFPLVPEWSGTCVVTEYENDTDYGTIISFEWDTEEAYLISTRHYDLNQMI